MRQINELSSILNNSSFIDYTNIRYDEIRVGVKAHLTDLDTGVPLIYIISGAFDTNIKEYKIAYDTPIGSQLLTMKVNETRIVTLPNGQAKKFKLIKIEKA